MPGYSGAGQPVHHGAASGPEVVEACRDEHAEPEAAHGAGGKAVRLGRRLSTNLAWNLTSELAARGASLWLAFYCARLLPVAHFGVFTFSLAVVQYVWLVGDGALNGGYAAREVARARGASIGPTGLFYTTRIAAALILTAVFLTAVLALPMAPEHQRALTAGACYFLAYASFPDWAARGSEDFRSLALGNLAYAICVVTGTLTLMGARPEPAMALMAWGTSFLAGGLVLVSLLHRRGVMTLRPRFSVGAWWPHAKRSSIFSIGALCGVGIVQIPTIQLGLLTGAREVGLFSAGFRLLVALFGAISILWWPLFPVLASERPASSVFGATIAGAASLVIALVVPATLALSLFAHDTMRLIFGAPYGAGAVALQIGAWALPGYALSGLLEQACLATGGEALRARIYGFALGAMLLAGAFLMPAYGAAGASATLVLGFTVSTSIFAWTLRKVIDYRAIARQTRGILIAGLVLGVVWVWASRVSGAARYGALIASGLVYAAVASRVVADRFRSPDDTRRPRSAATIARSSFWASPLPPLSAVPVVSVIMAIRNEERFIARALDAVEHQDYPEHSLQIVVVDGDSADRTPDVVGELASRDSRIHLVRNPRRWVASGLNAGISAARGDIIMRVDGHCVIPPDYVGTCVAMLRQDLAECVGGPVHAKGDTVLGRAIAAAMSSPVSVGGAAFRHTRELRMVSHLPFVAFRRELINVIGGFDETLIRNQDDEFSDRLISAGGRIVINPQIPVTYWSRSTLGGLWKQYFGYGYWKLRVIRKRGGWPSSPRHVLPSVLVAAILSSLFTGVISGYWVPVTVIALLYATYLAASTAWLSIRRREFASLLSGAPIATMHFAYGSGLIVALLSSPWIRTSRAS